MFYGLCRHVLNIGYCSAHVINHTLVHGDVLPGYPTSTHPLHHHSKGMLHFEEGIISRHAFLSGIISIEEMNVVPYELIGILRHGVVNVGEGDVAWCTIPKHL